VKPSGTVIETFVNEDTRKEETKAGIILSPDSTNGMFFGGGAAFTADSRVEVRAAVEDVERYRKTKSEKIKQKILDTYIQRKPGTDKYFFRFGAILGNMLVPSVLEVTKTDKSQENKSDS
jgi:hypothetical protein